MAVYLLVDTDTKSQKIDRIALSPMTSSNLQDISAATNQRKGTEGK